MEFLVSFDPQDEQFGQLVLIEKTKDGADMAKLGDFTEECIQTKKHVIQAMDYCYIKVLPLGVFGFVRAPSGATFEVRCGSSMTIELNYSKVQRILLPSHGYPTITLW